ncbi:MAG: M28 family peptidase [Elusimicrobia bacterium]|nr:M28 family peptidase [Elusimicrobiota bacterium]
MRLLFVAFLAAAAVAGLRAWDTYRLARLPLPSRPEPATPAEKRLAADVRALAGEIGPRSYAHPEGLARAEAHVKRAFTAAGYRVEEQPYTVRPPGISAHAPMRNFIAVLPAASSDAPVLVVGAHYDTALDTPGADDNASGVAALLELARRFKGKTGALEIRFVAYGTEEPPFFGSKQMGSAFHAASLKAEGRRVKGMISLEMLGYYDDAKGSQKYPPLLSLFYPDRANFIGAVSNLGSRDFLKGFAKSFKPTNNLLVVAASLPGWITEIGLSDHKCYWDEGFPGLILTDTSFLRYTHYHMATDTPEKLDYARMADVVNGLEASLTSMLEGH